VYDTYRGGPAAPFDKAGLTGRSGPFAAFSQTLANVTDDIGRRRTFNTAIAAVMSSERAWPSSRRASRRIEASSREALEIGRSDLSPIIPQRDACAVADWVHRTALIESHAQGRTPKHAIHPRCKWSYK